MWVFKGRYETLALLYDEPTAKDPVTSNRILK